MDGPAEESRGRGSVPAGPSAGGGVSVLRWGGPLTAALGAAAVAACASSLETGPPIPNSAAVADSAGSFPGGRTTTLLRFRWEYADERGNVRGQGAGRVNPPDSLRVDLFSSGDVSLGVALASGRLSSTGRIEGVRLPSSPFLYAMAGVFRPTREEPESAYSTERGLLFRYRTNAGLRREYLIRDGRLLRVEDRRDGRLLRRVRVRWDSGGAWPVSAEYHNTVASRRVRWRVEHVEQRSEPFDPDIYDLPRKTLPGG